MESSLQTLEKFEFIETVGWINDQKENIRGTDDLNI
jgi:hypothetical protein